MFAGIFFLLWCICRVLRELVDLLDKMDLTDLEVPLDREGLLENKDPLDLL